jgi:hypothetical protein
MDPASIIGPKVRNFLSNEDTGKQACFELAPGFFICHELEPNFLSHCFAVSRLGS